MAGTMDGITWYHRKMCTSSGILRKYSTQALPRRTVQGRPSSVRSVPITDPTTSATISDSRETDTVQPQADSIQSR